MVDMLSNGLWYQSNKIHNWYQTKYFSRNLKPVIKRVKEKKRSAMILSMRPEQSSLELLIDPVIPLHISTDNFENYIGISIDYGIKLPMPDAARRAFWQASNHVWTSLELGVNEGLHLFGIANKKGGI